MPEITPTRARRREADFSRLPQCAPRILVRHHEGRRPGRQYEGAHAEAKEMRHARGARCAFRSAERALRAGEAPRRILLSPHAIAWLRPLCRWRERRAKGKLATDIRAFRREAPGRFERHFRGDDGHTTRCHERQRGPKPPRHVTPPMSPRHGASSPSAQRHTRSGRRGIRAIRRRQPRL